VSQSRPDAASVVGVRQFEHAVSGAPGLALLTRGDGRVSHSHGITPTGRCRTPPCPAARRGTVSLVPRDETSGRRPA